MPTGCFEAQFHCVTPCHVMKTPLKCAPNFVGQFALLGMYVDVGLLPHKWQSQYVEMAAC